VIALSLTKHSGIEDLNDTNIESKKNEPTKLSLSLLGVAVGDLGIWGGTVTIPAILA
jgi:hypothetical protein